MVSTEPGTPTTPQTIEGVTVSEPRKFDNKYYVAYPHGGIGWFSAAVVRAMGLTVPEPTVPCRIGDQEFTLTGEQIVAVSNMDGCFDGDADVTLGAAARAHLDADSEAGR